MNKMGLEKPAQTATYVHPEKKDGEEGDVGKMGFEERAQTATHKLKAGRGRRRLEQNGIEGGIDGDSRSESGAGKKAT